MISNYANVFVFFISVREQLREQTKQYEKSENDLKALQSVGQVSKPSLVVGVLIRHSRLITSLYSIIINIKLSLYYLKTSGQSLCSIACIPFKVRPTFTK